MATIEAKQVVLKGREIVIRSCTVEDAEGLVELSRGLIAWEYSSSEPDEFAADVATMQGDIEKITREQGLLRLVAVDDGKVVGGLDFSSPARKRLRHRGRFGITVASDYRGHGVGTALIEAMLEWAREHPTIEKVRLSVLAVNVRAIRLYERLGFVEEGRRAGECRLPTHGYVDEVMMAVWVKGEREDRDKGEHRGH